jgi:type IV secretion system protein VirD4
VLLAASPRSGKGAGFVNTNMLNWNDSAVVLDIRKESYRVTSGFRAEHGQEVYLFNPLATDGKTCQWNPLSYVNDDPALRINDIQKIASMLFPDPLQGDPFWASSCRTLFLGLALYVFETDGLVKTIGEMLRQVMFGEGESIGEHWKKIIEDRDASDNPLSSTCQRSLYDFIFTSGNTQSSIRKTFTAKLELWLNPIVDAATSGDSFRLGDLRKRRISFYIGVEPGDLERVQVILNLLFQQILEENTREMPEDNPALKHKLLMMMDEFTAIGKVPILAKSVSYLGGYNIILCIVIQSPSQLRSEYGHDVAETIMTCMGANIVFAPRETKHAKEVSEALGFFGMRARSSSKPVGIARSMGSVNESEQRRELLMAQEVKMIGKLKEIVFIEDMFPILCDKIRYFKDKTFKQRLRPPVPVQPIDFRRAVPQLVKAKKPTSPEAGGLDLRMSEVESSTGSWREVKEIGAADMERVDKLSLQDFAGDLEKIEIPGEPITDGEMDVVVDMFLSTLSD